MSTLENLRAGTLCGVRELKLSCALTHFPPEIFTLADTLEVLDLSGNALSALPDDLPRLRKLRILFCSDNQFTELPAILGQCPNLTMIGFKANRIRSVPASALPAALRWLILTDNAIESIPAEIGLCSQLQKLMLAGNRIATLPGELARCDRLELLRISANRLCALPDWLSSMPRLAWLACAGNPFSEARERTALARTPIADIDWNSLEMEQQLGQGASGVIYRARYRPGLEGDGDIAAPRTETEHPDVDGNVRSADARDKGHTRAVAVKLFKGDITSDGLPLCEMAACFDAGRHENLISIEGRIRRHPHGLPGMMMPLVAPDLVNLAQPPSLASCTRDIYAADSRFTPAALLGIALGVARAASHLHQRGIMHGDLYGHNILYDGHGQVLLGDFGAASLYEAGSREGRALERLEVRAFGCLLEELLDRVAAATVPAADLEVLAALAGACLNSPTATRPSFAEIVAELGSFAKATAIEPLRSDPQ